MIEYITNLSQDLFSLSQQNTLSISDLYHEVAEHNYLSYHSYQKSLTKNLLIIKDEFERTCEIVLGKLMEDEENSRYFLDNYNEIDNSKSIAEHLFESPIETINNSNLVMSILSKSEEYEELRHKFRVDDLENDNNNVFKSGMTAIAFEAFACEALINQELLSIMSKQDVKNFGRNNRTGKRPVYIKKMEKIISHKGIEVDSEEIFVRLQRVMRARNQIAHFSGFTFDFYDLFKSIDSTLNRERHNGFYVCEVFKILDDPLEAYRSIRNILFNVDEF